MQIKCQLHFDDADDYFILHWCETGKGWEWVNFLMLMLIKVWVSFVPLHSWKGSSKAETCMKMCDRTVLHVSSVVLLNSCQLPSPCFNCGFYSPDHLTLRTTILNSLSQLYNTCAAQCSSCGLRTLDIAKHLDWHFRSIVPLFILYQLQPYCVQYFW